MLILNFICFYVLFVSVCMIILLCRIHDYNLFVKMLNFIFNFVLITYKGILQKISVTEIYICL